MKRKGTCNMLCCRPHAPGAAFLSHCKAAGLNVLASRTGYLIYNQDRSVNITTRSLQHLSAHAMNAIKRAARLEKVKRQRSGRFTDGTGSAYQAGKVRKAAREAEQVEA